MATRSTLIAAALATFVAMPFSVAAQGPSGEEKLAQLIGDRTPSEAKHCLVTVPGLDLYIIDETAIAYRSGTNIYVNRPENAGVLHTNDRLIDKRGELCKGDQVQIYNSSYGAMRGVIKLDDFVPYKPAKQASVAN